MVGSLASLMAAAAWMFITVVAKVPVSATQSIIGATIGYSLVLKGTKGIQWKNLIKIALTWVVSPILAGSVAIVLYMIIQAVALNRVNHVYVVMIDDGGDFEIQHFFQYKKTLALSY